MTVLVADDSPSNRKLLSAIFSREGFRVVEVADGVEALEVLEREEIDAVVSDILMPNMDGYRLCTEVRRSERFSSVPFIFYTSAYTSPSDEELALELGADRFIRKPAPVPMIVSAVRELVSGPRRIHQPVPLPADLDLTTEYAQRLVAKLEEKNEELCRRTQELHETGEKLQAVICAAPVAIITFDRQGNVTAWNPAAERIFGWSETEALGERPPYLSAEDQDEFDSLRQHLLAGKTITGLERQRCRRDGTRVNVELSGAPLHDADGEILGLVAILADITDRKKVEEAMAKSRDFYKALFDDFPTAIWQCGTDGRCNYVNPTWLKFTGRTLERELGDGWVEAVHPEDAARVIADYRKAFERRQAFELEYRLRRHDGECRHIVDYGRPFYELNGEFAGYTGLRHDITKRKSAEARLAKSEALLAEAQALAHIGSWDWDTGANVVFWSDELYRMMGLQPQECPVSYDAFLSCVHPEDRDRIDQMVQHAFQDHQPFEGEYRITLPHGITRIHRVNGVVITDDRRLVRVHGTAQDITAQSMAKEALRQSEQRFVAFMDNQPAFAWMKDLEGRLVYVNKRMEQLPEFQGGWEGKTDADIWPGEIAAEYRANDQKVMTSGEAVQTVEPYLTDGVRRYVLVNKFPIFDRTGAIVMVAGASVDITERIQAEKALRESEERFRQLAENINEVFWIRHVEPWHLEFVSVAYERIWKRSVESLYRQPETWMEAVHPEDRARVTREGERVRTKGEYDLSYRIIWPDGSVRWIRDRAFPVRDAQGNLVRIAGIAADVTESKESEQQREHFSQLLQALSHRLLKVQEEERRHLARELHDEIGQTLTAAKLNLKIIAPDVPQAAAARLDDSVQLLDRLLHQVRQLSLDLRPPLLDELGLLPALRWLTDQQAQRAGLRISLASNAEGAQVGPGVRIACFRLAQEGITNAIRHASAEIVGVELRREMDRLWLSVRDDGVGFDPAAVQLRAKQGASLGLLSMKERALLAGGDLEVTSAPGCGTHIRAWFPLTDVP